MIKTRVHITDTGMDDFVQQVKKLKGTVDIGVFGDKDSDQVIIAATNEFGTDKAGKGHNIKIPERSHLRAALDEQTTEIRKRVDDAKVAIVTGKIPKKTFLDRLGVWFVGQVQAKIRTGPFTANAAATKIRKLKKGRKDPKPLIDEGRLIQSYTHRVNEKFD